MLYCAHNRNGQETNQQDKKKPCNVHVHWYSGSIHGQHSYLVVVIVYGGSCEDDFGLLSLRLLHSQETVKLKKSE